VAAEVVSSLEFRAEYDKLPPDKQWEVAWALEEIEDDPSWNARQARAIAPADSPFSGFLMDLSVEGYLIVYRVVDGGAAVELWMLYHVPPPPKSARARPVSSPPMM